MKKIFLKAVVIFSVIVSIFSCGEKNKNVSEHKVKVGIISTRSGFGDGAFNDLTLKGLDRAKEDFGIEYDKVQIKAVGDIELSLRDMAATEEYDLIIGLTYEAIQAMNLVAPEFPNQKFALIDNKVEQPNVVCYMTKDEEGSFLVGVAAASINEEADLYNIKKSDKLGFIGGVDAPNIKIFYTGYAAGAKYVDNNLKTIPDFVGSFVDVTTAKEIANSMNNQNINIIYHASGMSGNGLFQAAKENKTLAFGVNLNQNKVEPDFIVGSMIKNADIEAYEAIKKVVENNFKGEIIKLGLKENGIDFVTEGSNVKLSEKTIKLVNEAKVKIINGEIKVPSTAEELEKF